MSFTLNRNNSFLPIKKNLTKTNTINPNSLKSSIGSGGIPGSILLNSLTLNNEVINSNSDQLNYLQVTPGIADELKALVLNSTRDITNIRNILCSESIIVNGITITNINDIPTGSSDDVNNILLTNITPGIGLKNKALIVDSNHNITNINSLSVNNIKINETNLKLNTDNKYHLENVKKAVYPQNISIVDNIVSNFRQVSSTATFFQGGKWNSICWSQELNMFVAIARSNTINANTSKIMNSTNGIEWNSCNDILQSTGYNSICWSSELNMFIAVGNSIIVCSYDGINWISCDIEYNINLQSVCWSPELNLFVAVGNSTTTNRILKSNDGLYWYVSHNGVYSHDWVSVCWANKLNLFIASASSGNENIYRIMVSNDGDNWEIIKHSLFTNTSISNLTWCEELNIIIATNSTNSKIIRSYDGFLWEACFSNEVSNSLWIFDDLTSVIWIDELHVFVATVLNKPQIYISYNGIKWTEIAFSFSRSYVAIAWSPSLGLVLIDNSDNNSSRICISKVFTNKSCLNNNVIYSNPINNNIGINTNNTNARLEINSDDGKCLKLNRSSSDMNTTFNINENGVFDIDVRKSSTYDALNINIKTNFTNYGLKLNNILLKSNITEYSYLSNITNGIGSASKVLIVDSNKDINNINHLSCSTLTVNGVNVDNQTNNVLSNISYGNVSESKAIFTDINNNINNINQLSTNNSYSLNYDNYYGSSTSENFNINNYLNKFNNYNYSTKFQNLNLITSSNWNLINNSITNWNDACYSPELNLIVVVGNAGNIIVSNNGKFWNTINIGISNVDFRRICWSPELNLFVAVSNSGQSFSNFISYNGYQWIQTRINITSSATVSIIWVKELKSFVLIQSSSTDRVYLSPDGINWHKGGISSLYSWNSVCWANKLGLLIVCSSNSSFIATSPNGIEWSYIKINDASNTGFSTICWSEELNMIIASGSTAMAYSYNGINWFVSSVSALTINHLLWSTSLQMFIGCGGNSNFSYSYNGLHWLNFTPPTTLTNWSRICWIPELSMILSVSTNGTNRIAYVIINGSINNCSQLFGHKSQIFFNKNNGSLGLGTESPDFQLTLSTDSAAKPVSAFWTVSSDSRLKENIENADLDICYNIIKTLKLKRYKWKDNIFNKNQIKDRNQLGWIADDCEIIFPKAVQIKNSHGLTDCKTLNIDQILASSYGCTQKLINEYENLDIITNSIDTKLNIINEFINKLE